MELLRELTRLQHDLGYLSDETLRRLAKERTVPLYRLEGLVSFYPYFRRTPPPRVLLHACRDISCSLAGEQRCQELVREKFGDETDIEIHEVSCLGRCDAAPALSINDVPLAPISLNDAEKIERLIADPAGLPQDEPTSQLRQWRVNPYNAASDWFGTVQNLVASGRDIGATCIEQIQQSGLSGMGGAGFPTGRKWELVAGESVTPKYVICNADESEPGTFKDRVILEELPHLVIEGMILAGLTIGAEKGIVYLRHEYTREYKALSRTIEIARERGILGNNAAGSEQPFDIEIFLSPGGYILGEETALLEALEDKRGEPRNKPPYPGTHGLWGKPTLINNVETFALATTILHHGVDWWKKQGRENCVGLKFVSISGDVNKPGVYEIPVGTPVSELIELAGGMRNGIPLKAFLPGGASSRFLRSDQAETPLDFAAMQQTGSMLGTGAVIVFNETRDLFAAATNIVSFFRNESCGKCVPCRVGSEKAVKILESIAAGTQSTEALTVLPDLGETLQQTSICGLGQVAITPILSMMELFPEEVPASK